MDQPVPTIEVEPPKTNWLLFSLIGSAILIVGIAAGLMIGKYVYTPKPTPFPTISVSPTPVATVDPTANWKTYTNTKYGFKVKYNPDLNPTERSGGGETVGQFTYLQTISFGTNPIKSPYGYEVEVNKKSLGDYRTEIVGHISDKIDSEKEITINSNSWTKITYKIFLTTDYVSVTKAVANHNEYGYAVTASATDIDQILSTFRFAN